MNTFFDHSVRPWRDPEDPNHVECLRCGEPIRPAGSSWRHEGEEAAPNRPLPGDTAMFDTALELATKTARNLPPGADDDAKAFAIIDILYWRGGLTRGRWERPDRRGGTAA